MSAPYKVVAADDHPMIREGLRAVLATLPDFELVAEAGTGDEAIEAVAATGADIVIMDLHMPGIDGAEATRRILTRNPNVRILVLTMFDNDEMLVAGLRAGARGYLVKGANHAEIAGALRSVAAGEAVFGKGVADQVLDRLSGRVTDIRPFPQLTTREFEILDLLASGLGTRDIARKVFLTDKTVRNYIAIILTKLEVPDRAQAIVAAQRAGLGADA
jgi:DNA-binding NarL/FixJ family response regulator